MHDWDLLLTDSRIATLCGDAADYGVISADSIAISDGRIAWIGTESERPDVSVESQRSLNGNWITPALIDCHTHLDAQIMWDPWMAPATTNGIGTVVFGNCGCGFAPCAKEDRNFLIELM